MAQDEHDMTDPHGEAEALRKENARLRLTLRHVIAERDGTFALMLTRAEAAEAALAKMGIQIITDDDMRRKIEEGRRPLDERTIAQAATAYRMLHPEAVVASRAPDTFAETQPTALRVLPTFTSANATDKAPLAASRAPDPVANADSCQPGDLISRAAAIEGIARLADVCDALIRDGHPYGPSVAARRDGLLSAISVIHALPAAPVDEAPPAIGGAELDALVARLHKLARDMDRDAPYDWDEHEDVTAAADAITALRAQPDWKKMAEQIGKATSELVSFCRQVKIAGHAVDKANRALSVLAKMKGE